MFVIKVDEKRVLFDGTYAWSPEAPWVDDALATELAELRAQYSVADGEYEHWLAHQLARRLGGMVITAPPLPQKRDVIY